MKSNNVFKIINTSLLILFVAVVVARLYYTDKTATAGNDLAVIDNKIISLQKENEALENEYLKLTSLSSINAKASEMGLANVGVEYLTPPALAAR